MVKIVARDRAGSYQRLVVMTEKEYEELRAASLLLPSKNTGPGNSLVEKYLDDNKHPELSISERLTLFNQAVAREEAGRQFTEGRSVTSTTKLPGKNAPTAENLDITATQAEPTSSAADVKHEEAAEVEVKEQDKPDTILPNITVPELYERKLAALKEILQASGTVSVDKLGLVYIDRTLLSDKSNYSDLMRSMFVSSMKGAKLAGRDRFLEHLHKLGVTANHVSTRSAKNRLERLALPPKQEGKGNKTQRKASGNNTKSSRPPGKRPKVLLMYR